MEEEFIVYDTTDVSVGVDSTGHKIVECTEDGSQFIFFEKIGRGSFSKVNRCERRWAEEDRTLSYEYAVKAMHKGMLHKQRCVIYDEDNQMIMTNNLDKVLGEVAVWRQLCHPNVVRLYEVINDPSHELLYLIIEYCDLGQIMTWNSEEQRYLPSPSVEAALQALKPELFESSGEAAAKMIFSQVAKGLAYLQSPAKRVVHRDLKPDNILYSTRDHKVKVTDFTVSKQLSKPLKPVFDPCGTVPFQSES
jgi:[calcium/calmodulin-dependent protein kinase] kinase